ncbi:MAG: polyphenol oxidase family protein [Actinomycetales bacterium]
MANTLFTNRSGGKSLGPFASKNLALHVGDDRDCVLENRALLSKEISIAPDRIFYMNQVHGANIVTIDNSSDVSVPPTADGLFTELNGIALAVLTADCSPLLLYSETAIAAVHIGRKGLIAGALEAAFDKFNQLGIPPREVLAEIGPAICRDCYQIDLASYREFVNVAPSAGSDEDMRCVDVSLAIAAKLDRLGVTYKKSNICVSHAPGFFSYRRDGITGRQAGVIWL